MRRRIIDLAAAVVILLMLLPGNIYLILSPTTAQYRNLKAAILIVGLMAMIAAMMWTADAARKLLKEYQESRNAKIPPS